MKINNKNILSMKQVRPFTYWTSVIVFGVVFGTGLQIVGAWTEPILPPPNGNISGPLTTSATGQTKEGNLVISTLNTIVNGFIVVYGNVGIGTWNPQAKLHVNGKIKSSSTTDADTGNVVVTKDYLNDSTKLKRITKLYSGDPANNDSEGALFCPSGYEAVLCQNFRERPVADSYPFGGIKFAFKATKTNDYPAMFSPGGCVASYCGADNSYECTVVALCQKI